MRQTDSNTSQQTISLTTTQQTISLTQTQQTVGSLRLQAAARPSVSWDSEVVDNEHLNKKKSKLCCIYHKHGVDSDSSSGEDNEGNAYEKQPTYNTRKAP
jgi:protein phosphatase 1 regulatory subunit 11